MLLHGRTPSDPLRSLQDAVARCLQLPCVQPMTRIAALRAAIQTVKISGSDQMSVINDAAAINRLPGDLLIQVFSYIALVDRPSARRVCRRWKSVIDDLDQCWDNTDIWDTIEDGFAKATAVLALFPTSPVCLSLVTNTTGSAAFDLIAPHLSRIRRLSICVMPALDTIEESPSSCGALVLALESPMPLLEELDMWRVDAHCTGPEEVYLSDGLLARVAPRLRSLTLHRFALHDTTYPALAGLHTLSLSQCEVDIAQIMTSCPMLEQLLIDSASLVGGDIENRNSQHLELLHVPGTTRAADIICNSTVLSRPLTVWAEGGEQSHLFAYIVDKLRRQNALRLQLLFHARLMQPACVVTYSTGLSWAVELWPRHSYLAFCDTLLMASITELAIHELVWPRQPLELPSPAVNLALLELILHRPSTSGQHPSLVGILYDDDESLRILHCPSLKTLSLLAPYQPSLTVDVFDVLAVIERRLRFSAERLACLRLRNVLLYDPALGRGMALLTARVSQIEYCGFRAQEVPYVHKKHDSMAWVYGMLG